MNDRRTSRALLFIRCSDGRILQASAAAEHIYQRSQKELAALTMQDLRARQTKASVAKCIPKANRRVSVRREMHRRKDGTTFPVDISWEPITFGSAPTTVAVIRDLTELENARDGVHGADYHLLTQISHELRNALAPIHYCLQVLDQSEPGSDAAIKSLSTIGQQVDELSRAVDRIAGIGNLLANGDCVDPRAAAMRAG